MELCCNYICYIFLFFFDLLIDDPSKQYRYFSLRFFVNFSNLHQSPNVSSNSLNYFQPQSFPSASVPHAGLVCQEEISALSSMLHHPSPKNLQDRPRRLWRRKQTWDPSKAQMSALKKGFCRKRWLRRSSCLSCQKIFFCRNTKMKNEAIKNTSRILFTSVTPVWTKFGSCRWNLKSAPGIKRMYMSLFWQV